MTDLEICSPQDELPAFTLWFFFVPEISPNAILLQPVQRLRQPYKKNPRFLQNLSSKSRRSSKDLPRYNYQALPDHVLRSRSDSLKHKYHARMWNLLPIPRSPSIGIPTTLRIQSWVAKRDIRPHRDQSLVMMWMYFSLRYFIVIPDVMKDGLKSQEHGLKPELLATFGPLIELFVSCTVQVWGAFPCLPHTCRLIANVHVHWIASVIGIGIHAGSVCVPVV
jgi:hypothetical protein